MTVLTIVIILTGIAMVFIGVCWSRGKRAWEEAKSQATSLNRELQQPDSKVKVIQIWSDEQMEQNCSQLANEILEKVGNTLSADESEEGKCLYAFLVNVHPTLADSPSPRDIGRAWFSCMQVQDAEPESELAQSFKELNEAWTATRDGEAQKVILTSRTILKSGAATLIQTDTPS
jgi:hypothetical protein